MNGFCRPVVCDPQKEPLASALDNFIVAFFGTVPKTCVNDKVVWSLPCDLEAGIAGFPRNDGEGLACYMFRLLNCLGDVGYDVNTLSDTDATLTCCIDPKNQELTGTLTAPVAISLLVTNAFPGATFRFIFNGLVTSGANTLTLQSNGTDVEEFSDDGAVYGFCDMTWNGSAWIVAALQTNVIP